MGNQILITKSYEDIFHRITCHCTEDEGNARGVVLTGQPGVGVSVIRPPPRVTTHQRTRSPGKTTFLNFMLTRLISAGQLVLLCEDSEFHLFYNDKCALGRRGLAYAFLLFLFIHPSAPIVSARSSVPAAFVRILIVRSHLSM